jgi:hypothetical protein
MKVAKPSLSELVRNQRIARKIQVRRLVVERPVGLRRRRGVLHAAEDEVGYRNLRIARVRIRRTGASFEELEHSRRGAKSTLAVLLAPGQHVVEDRNAVLTRGSARDLDERSGDHRHKIGAVRDVLAIPEDRVTVLVSAL